MKPVMTFEELIKNHSADVIEKLITEVLSKDSIEVHFDFLEGDQWSIITTHQYEEDKEISLRLHLNDYYDLYFGYYDDEDEFIELVHPLTEEEKKILPVRLKKVMKKPLSPYPSSFLKLLAGSLLLIFFTVSGCKKGETDITSNSPANKI